eukprot:CAMPEP_0115250814 /NCGR_PEP_ID=MMETSP0270-20121206/43305_1 /TAXON_ID=71861 /ORGANISM="Scrippsiella trochoidea, Strain CCMP3099" /LENGTH=89 /DNA_ID=CAMNT_0002666209 /DNA_START=579 /DNA_END=845 /DNA_ORIENTATION=+
MENYLGFLIVVLVQDLEHAGPLLHGGERAKVVEDGMGDWLHAQVGIHGRRRYNLAIDNPTVVVATPACILLAMTSISSYDFPQRMPKSV